MEKQYTPSKKILENYAKVLVNFGLNNGIGVKKGQVVRIVIEDSAKPLLKYLMIEILKKKANYMITYIPSGDKLGRIIYEYGDDNQLTHTNHNSIVGRIKDTDCQIVIISEVDKNELKGINPKKIMLSKSPLKKYRDLIDKKEQNGKFSWTLALYGTNEMAKEVGISPKKYWDQIIKACYLNDKNPVKKNKEVQQNISKLLKKLNSLKIEKVNVISKDTDLWVKLGKNRRWLGGRGCNIPSFEVFISPDFRETEGKIRFNEKLYRFSNIIEDIYLEFKNGKVVKAKAKKGENVLKEMIKQKGANMVGEFSLTDIRFSKIDTFMGETLYDENVGKKYGNTHIALGSAYKDSYSEDKKKQVKVTKKQWEKMGYNDSIEHTDIVSTYNREVYAYKKNGEKFLLYKDGKFQINF